MIFLDYFSVQSIDVFCRISKNYFEGSQRIWKNLEGFGRIQKDSIGFQRKLKDSKGFGRIQKDFIGFQRKWKDSEGFGRIQKDSE